MQPDRRATLSAARSAGAALLGLLALFALAAPALCPAGPAARAGSALLPPSQAFPAGTDDLGRNVLCMTAFGLRTSLAMGAGAGAVGLTLGVAIGLAAGVLGGWTDLVLMRATEVMQAVPRLFLVILASALFEPNLPGLAVLIGLTSWAALARLARAEAMAVGAQDFVRAARALGVSRPAIIRRHLLPNTLRPLVAAAAPLVAAAILAEAALSYLGLGAPSTVSLGRMIADAQPFLGVAWWMSAAPVGTLVLATFAVLLLSETRRPA